MMKKSLTTCLLAVALACSPLLSNGAENNFLPKVKKAEASLLGNIGTGLVKEFLEIFGDPAKMNEYHQSVKADFASAVILQREAYDEYVAFSESRDYQAGFDRAAMYRDIMNGGMPQIGFLRTDLSPQELETKLNSRTKIKELLPAESRSRLQSIADKRHAAQAYRNRAAKNAGRMLLATAFGALDSQRRTSYEIVENIGYIISAVSSIKDYTDTAEQCERPTRKFLDSFEERLEIKQKDRKKLLKQDWGFQENGTTDSSAGGTFFKRSYPSGEEESL